MRTKETIGAKVLYPALLAGLTLLFYFDTLFLGNSFSYRDIYRYFYPYKKFAAEWLQSGVFPHWNPLNSCGTPFYAGLQSQVVYPLSLLYYSLPFDFGFNLFIAAHFFLAGLFMYYLCQEFGLKKYSAFFAAAIFAFSGYMVSVVEMLTTLSAITWVPLILLFYKKALSQEKLKETLLYAFLTAVFLVVQFLGGEPTVIYVTVGILVLFSLFCFEKKTVFVLFGVLLFALLFSAFQLLPFLEFLKYSDRNSQSEAITRILNGLWSFPPEGILALIIPSFFRQGSLSEFLFAENNQLWLKSAFIGLVPFVLALGSVFYIFNEEIKKKKYLLFFLLLGLIALFLAVGRFNMFYEKLYLFLPGYKQIRFPVKFLFPVILSSAFLAGYTLEKIFETKQLYRTRLIRIILVAGICMIAAGLLVYYSKNFVVAFLVSIFNPAVAFSSLYYAYQSHKEASLFFLQSTGIFIFLAVIVSFYLLGKLKKEFVLGTVIIISALELYIHNGPVNQRINSSFYSNRSGIELFLKNHSDAGRVYLLKNGEQEAWLKGETFHAAMEYAKNRLYPNQNMLSGISVVSGYDSIMAGEQFGLLDYINKHRKRRYLNLLSARYIVTEETLDQKTFPGVYTFGGVNIYENIDYLPRCFAAKTLKVFSSESQGLEYIKSDLFDPAKETIVNEPLILESLPFGGGEVLKIIAENPNNVKIEAGLKVKRLIVLNDTYYPGWKVFEDKKKEKLYRVNGIFRGVLCPPGKHEIVFEYEPLSLKKGLLISIISVLTVICILFVLYFKKKKRKEKLHGRTARKTNRRSKN
ncbi:MAG: YfhO family protein [Candidatus Firestonebacteria bacterium]